MSTREEKLKQYFIALIPPSPIYDDAWRLKNYFREQYNSKASLNSPPHITLHMPFRWKEEKEFELVTALHSFTQGRDDFKIQLQNYGAFPPRVVFIDIVANDSLTKLYKDLHRFCKRELNLFNAAYKDQSFHPHLTLAFRDLKKPLFFKAWEEFQARTFSAHFDVEKIVLLKHNGKIWETFKAFYFKAADTAEDQPSNSLEMHL
ncbi:2'-5' RNA ligase family protein [Pseudochryseolinea flava]|uniref:2'-5' RNA ligase family protein n=1 Tax=Pseudochryseolinea flava TaxID=2059302 RepID=A0A364Y869_9BACT|nr:2'-5' RNA ligase family protein [Pseudochryseolinea flava]RAW03281.1 2'-5' RNA ligase family protein [Pseudochryseolinea flava]